MASLSNAVNFKKLLGAQQNAINANVDAKATETKNHVTTKNDVTNAEIASKAVDTQNAIVTDGDITQAQLTALTTVNGDINTEVQAINAHVTAENDRVLANIPSNSPVNTVQRGVVSNFTSINAGYFINIASVNMAKSTLVMNLTSANTTAQKVYVTGHLFSPTQIRVINIGTNIQATISWEVIEYA